MWGLGRLSSGRELVERDLQNVREPDRGVE
jgi:hypothetical protein